MQKVTHSEYIAQKKPLAKQLLAKLNEKYQYASVLITDNYEKRLSCIAKRRCNFRNKRIRRQGHDREGL